MWSSFGWSTMKQFSKIPLLSIGTFQNIQREVIYFSFVVRKKVSELSKYFSMHCKSREISGPYNFLTPIKSNIPDVWNWTCWTLFVLENEWGEAWPLYTPSGGYAPAHVHVPLSRLLNCKNMFHIITRHKRESSFPYVFWKS